MADKEQDSRQCREARHNDRSARAWLVVIGAFLWMMVSQGRSVLAQSWTWLTSVGVLLVHGLLIAEIDTHFGKDPRHTWLSGIASFVAMVSSPFLGVVMDTFGPVLMGLVAVISTSGVFIGLSLCKNFGHLVAVFLWHGLTCGLCIAIGPSMAGKLFEKHGGLAQGITMCGSSLAGVIFAAVFHTVYEDWHIGNQIFAVAAGIIAVLALLATFLFNGVLPDECKVLPGWRWKSFKSQLEGLISVQKLFQKATWERNCSYAWFIGGSFFLQFAIFGTSATVPFIAESIGASEIHGQHCLIALSGASFLGRLMSGWLADSVGHFMTLFWTCVAEVIILATGNIILADKGVLPLYFASATWGFFSGCWVPLFAACVGKISEPREFGKFFGKKTPRFCIMADFLGISNLIISPSSLLAAPLMRYTVEHFPPRVLYGGIAAIVAVGAAMVFVSRRCRLSID